MSRYEEHAVFAAIVMLVVGGIVFQMARADAVTLAPTGPAAVKTIWPLDAMQPHEWPAAAKPI